MRALRYSLLAIAVSVLGLLGWRSVQNRPLPVAAAPLARAVPQVAEQAPPTSPPPAAPSLPAPPSISGQAPAQPPVSAPAPQQPTADQRIAEVPEFANFYEKLRTAFPQDYETFRTAVAAAHPLPSADAAIWDAMRDLQQARGVLAAGADAPSLDHYFDARTAMVAGLAPLSPRLCADFLYGQTGASIADFTASHRGLVATLAERQLAAITDGLAEHLERSPPTDADVDSLAAALKARGLSPAEVGLLVDGEAPDPPLTDARFCAIGETYLETLHDLPPDARNRLYGLAAELLARS